MSPSQRAQLAVLAPPVLDQDVWFDVFWAPLLRADHVALVSEAR
jgi:hypothetical protein